MFKKRSTIKKMKQYLKDWDTGLYEYVLVMGDGRLIPTNNLDLGDMRLCRSDFINLIRFIEQNA